MKSKEIKLKMDTFEWLILMFNWYWFYNFYPQKKYHYGSVFGYMISKKALF